MKIGGLREERERTSPDNEFLCLFIYIIYNTCAVHYQGT